MFLDRLMDNDNMPLLDRMLNFTQERQRLIADDIANVDTPNYVQKDLSWDKFQTALRDRVTQRDAQGPGTVDFNDIDTAIANPVQGILFHDGNNRSMEQLMSDQAKNAMMHQLVVELLRQQYQTMQTALKEKIS